MHAKTLGAITILFLSLSNAHAFYAHTAEEATLRFDHWVEIPDSSPVTAQTTIEQQLKYLVGPMAETEFPSAPKFDHTISNIRVKAIEDNKFVALYNYEGTIIKMNGHDQKLILALPVNPQTIWKTSQQPLSRGELNPCTDETYQTHWDFSYFWSPERPGCKDVIKENQDFLYLKYSITPLPNTKSTYPKYAKTVDGEGNIVMTFLIGKDSPNRLRSPSKRKGKPDDLNAKNYRGLSRELSAMGFSSREWTLDEVKKIVQERVNPYPFVMEFRQSYNGKRVNEIIVRLVYSNNMPDYNVTGFLYFLEDTLKNSSLMIFDGHSGIGLDSGLPGVRKSTEEKFDLAMDANKYQIFFFNSCSSYSYYNDGIFKRKHGSENLDVISTGLGTTFEGSVTTNAAFVNAFHLWAKSGHETSYQRLIKDLDTDNMVGVNGDED